MPLQWHDVGGAAHNGLLHPEALPGTISERRTNGDGRHRVVMHAFTLTKRRFRLSRSGNAGWKTSACQAALVRRGSLDFGEQKPAG